MPYNLIMSIRIIIIFLCLIFFLSSCGNTNDHQRIGQVIGSISGSVLGSKIGSGTGKKISIVSGSFVGSIVGGNIAKKLSNRDIELISAKTNEALNQKKINKQLSWKNEKNGNSGYVEAIKELRIANKNCKEIKQVLKTEDKIDNIYKIACKQQDGSWKISREE